jgi:hypothetical protein
MILIVKRRKNSRSVDVRMIEHPLHPSHLATGVVMFMTALRRVTPKTGPREIS